MLRLCCGVSVCAVPLSSVKIAVVILTLPAPQTFTTPRVKRSAGASSLWTTWLVKVFWKRMCWVTQRDQESYYKWDKYYIRSSILNLHCCLYNLLKICFSELSNGVPSPPHPSSFLSHASSLYWVRFNVWVSFSISLVLYPPYYIFFSMLCFE